jgi:hypothetical protein
MEVTTSLISSRKRRGWRLEAIWRRCALGSRVLAQSGAKLTRPKTLEEAPDQKEEVWEKVEGAYSPASLDSGGNGRWYLRAPMRDCDGLAA